MFKSIVRKLIFPNTHSSERFCAFLREKGVRVGNNSIFYSPNNTKIDLERPHMLIIGDNCKITSGVRILTHDYSKSVFLNMPGYEDVGEAGLTQIGNNCFIGVDSIILMGCKIGENCIIGAGSVCSGIYPCNSVICGNPAKVICTIDEFYKKRKQRELSSAKEYVREFRNVFNRDPLIEEMTNTFMWIYLPRTKETIKKNSVMFKHSGVSQTLYDEKFLQSTPLYDSFEEFLKDCK